MSADTETPCKCDVCRRGAEDAKRYPARRFVFLRVWNARRERWEVVGHPFLECEELEAVALGHALLTAYPDASYQVVRDIVLLH